MAILRFYYCLYDYNYYYYLNINWDIVLFSAQLPIL